MWVWKFLNALLHISKWSSIKHKNRGQWKAYISISKQEYTEEKLGIYVYIRQNEKMGSSCCGSAVANWASIHEDASSIPVLTQWVKDPALPWAVV